MFLSHELWLEILAGLCDLLNDADIIVDYLSMLEYIVTNYQEKKIE